MGTLGERRVRTTFNISGLSVVEKIKNSSAALINDCEEMRVDSTNPEKLRLISLAQTAYEEAAMWAVKAATI